MERLAELSLIKTEYTEDRFGQQKATETVGDPVVVALHSITRQEWSAAEQRKLQPLCMVKAADSAMYSGETRARLRGSLDIPDDDYTIYRAYPTDDGGIELYLQKGAT